MKIFKRDAFLSCLSASNRFCVYLLANLIQIAYAPNLDKITT